MERTKLLTVAVLGLLLLNLITIGFLVLRSGKQRGPEQHRSLNGEGPSRIIIGRLNFDSQQQQQYQKLIAAHQKQTRLLADQSVQLYRDYYGLLKETQPDNMRASSLGSQIAQNQREQAELNFAHFKAIKALCRPEQQAAFEALVNDLSRLFGRQQRRPRLNHDGPRGGGPDGPGQPDMDGLPEGPPQNSPPRP